MWVETMVEPLLEFDRYSLPEAGITPCSSLAPIMKKKNLRKKDKGRTTRQLRGQLFLRRVAAQVGCLLLSACMLLIGVLYKEVNSLFHFLFHNRSCEGALVAQVVLLLAIGFLVTSLMVQKCPRCEHLLGDPRYSSDPDTCSNCGLSLGKAGLGHSSEMRIDLRDDGIF